MDQSLIFWPMVAHFILVIIVYMELGRRRFLAAKSGQIKYDDYKVVKGGIEPEFVGQAQRNVVNNFEAPVFFHSVVLAIYVTNLVTTPLLVLAWLFVGSRYLHSVIHLTWNNVWHRALCFIGGVFFLVLMWGLFAIGLSAGPLL